MHMPCLFVIAGPDEGCLHALDADKPATVGRGDDAILQLVDERSSLIHCCVQSSSVVSSDFGMPVTQWVVSDAGSSNGTRVGSDLVLGKVTLKDGDTIRLGRTAIVYLRDSLTDAEAARTRCKELNIQVSDELAGWPMNDPAEERTLGDNE